MTQVKHAKSTFYDLTVNDDVFIEDSCYVVTGSAKGGMGFVLFLTRDDSRSSINFNALGKHLALKTILQSKRFHNIETQLFHRELMIWAGFRHRNIVWLLQILESKDTGWIAAMDECTDSLRSILNKEAPLSTERASQILIDIINGLDYAHTEYGALHLDLKPENILYHVIGERYMVSDWGLASIKQLQLEATINQNIENIDPSNTFNNGGTILYMAPERLITGVRSSIASDVFSLGIIYLEILTGMRPYNSNTLIGIQLVKGTYLDTANQIMVAHAIPGQVKNLILSMISFEANKRPSNYKCLRTLLERNKFPSRTWLSRIFNF